MLTQLNMKFMALTKPEKQTSREKLGEASAEWRECASNANVSRCDSFDVDSRQGWTMGNSASRFCGKCNWFLGVSSFLGFG